MNDPKSLRYTEPHLLLTGRPRLNPNSDHSFNLKPSHRQFPNTRN